MNKLFDDKLNEFESQWLKWNEKDIVFWFKYKLKWFETNIVNANSYSNNNDDLKEDEMTSELLAIDFDKILTNLEKQKLCGKFLSVLNKSDLNNLGFELMKHQLLIYKSIQKLILKYPIPPENDDDDGDEGIEGQVATSELKKNSKVDKKIHLSIIKPSDDKSNNSIKWNNI